MDSMSQTETIKFDLINQEKPKSNLIKKLGDTHTIKNIENNIFEEQPSLKKPKKRCNHPECSKKIKLTDVECRCKNIYCIKHRLPENHNCNFDYKLLEKEILRKSLNKVVADKINKI